MTINLKERPRQMGFIVGDVPGGESGVSFGTGHVSTAAAMDAGTLVAFDADGKTLIAWNTASANASAHVLAGILCYHVDQSYTDTVIPASFLKSGPCRVKGSYGALTYPGSVDGTGKAAAVAALAALWITYLD